MVDLFGKSGKPQQRVRPPSNLAANNIRDLIAKKQYPKAIEALRAELQKRRGDERLRIQLADTLALVGRAKEAVEVLNALADDLALIGQAGKAISALKKIEKLDPGREDIEEKLSYLITHQSKPAFDPWSRSKKRIEKAPAPYDAPPPPREPAFGMEEMSDEPDPAFASPPPPAAEAAAPPSVAAAAQAAHAALSETPSEPAAEPSLADLFSDDASRDQLAGMLDEVFTPAAGPSESVKGESKLVETPLFKDFAQDELLAVIRGLRLHTFEPGEILVSAGEPGDSLYLLTTGSVRAYMRDKRGKHVPVREMHDGDFFGEMSILTGRPRSATITASTYCELLELDQKTLNEIAAKHPNVRVVLQEFYKKRSTHSVDDAAGPASA